jgi:hypothetical protein
VLGALAFGSPLQRLSQREAESSLEDQDTSSQAAAQANFRTPMPVWINTQMPQVAPTENAFRYPSHSVRSDIGATGGSAHSESISEFQTDSFADTALHVRLLVASSLQW